MKARVSTTYKNIVNFIFLQKSKKNNLKVYERGVEKPAKI